MKANYIEKNNTEKNNTLIVLIGEEEFDVSAIDASVLQITDFDWNRDLSPWPAPRLFKREDDFAGMADEMVCFIDQHEVWEKTWEKTYIVGYSLAGLFALYACTKLKRFDGCASVSGSLWYSDWLAYCKEHSFQIKKAYLSLGDKESQTKNPIMSTVGTNTEETVKILESQGINTFFTYNPGNHFFESDKRLMNAIKSLFDLT